MMRDIYIPNIDDLDPTSPDYCSELESGIKKIIELEQRIETEIGKKIANKKLSHQYRIDGIKLRDAYTEFAAALLEFTDIISINEINDALDAKFFIIRSDSVYEASIADNAIAVPHVNNLIKPEWFKDEGCIEGLKEEATLQDKAIYIVDNPSDVLTPQILFGYACVKVLKEGVSENSEGVGNELY